MSKIVGKHPFRRIIVGLALAGAVATTAYSGKDLKRYLRMRTM